MATRYTSSLSSTSITQQIIPAVEKDSQARDEVVGLSQHFFIQVEGKNDYDGTYTPCTNTQAARTRA